MMNKIKPILFSLLLLNSCANLVIANAPFPTPSALPEHFVYLKDIEPSIFQDIRYSGYHNFIGRPIKGYEADECILTKQSAEALKKVQNELLQSNLSLKVYDCYRPQMAVDDFIAWSRQPLDQKMKAEFYPRVDKKDFFKIGYMGEKSAHSRGSTVDVTIVALPALQQAEYHRGGKLISCYAPFRERFADNSIDMGTGFDCFDTTSYPNNQNLGIVAKHNRELLQEIMLQHGFLPYAYEWWHFTLREELYPNKMFNFPIVESLY